MKIYSVLDKEFAPYGKVLQGYDTAGLMKALDEKTPLPEGVEYVMSDTALETVAIFGELQNNAYGGMPIQLGWCNGHNTKLNCLEYHRDSELNIGLYDFILLVAKADDIVDGKYLYNRCHLIGYQLTAENANKNNLITGTRYLNVTGMLPFENMVADYIKETNNHVLYRVTPIFEGNDLVAKGVQMEAKSVEDNGEGIEFNVFVYNIQNGIEIDYKTGDSSLK